MKMDLKGFHKVSKDGNTTVLRHPEGHEMTINHSILSPKMRGEIEALPTADKEKSPDIDIKPQQSLADGGDVEDTSVKEVEDSYNKFAGTIKPQPKPMTREEKNAAIRQRNSTNATGETSALDQPVYADGGDVKPEDKLASKEELDKSVEQETKPPVFNDELEASIPDEEVEANKSADAVPEAQIESAVNEPEYDHAKDMLQAHGAAMDAHNTAMKLYAASQQPIAQQEQRTPQSQQLPVQDAQTVQPDQAQPSVVQPQGFDSLSAEAHGKINDLQSYITDQKAKNDQLSQSVLQNKIDPNRLYGNAGTGTKITTAVGLILGGLGAGASGGKNLAVDAMNTAIERDVDAQKANQSNQMNLYKTNLEATHNEEEARNMTVNQLLSAAQGQLNKAGLANQTAASVANIQNVNQEIEQKKIANSQNSFLFNQLKGNGTGGQGDNSEASFQNKMNTLRLLKPDYAKDLEAKYLPGVGVASVPIPEKERSDMIARTDLSKKLATLENFSREHSGSLDPAIIAQGHAMAVKVQDAYRSGNQQGVFKPAEAEFVNKAISENPTAFFAKYRTLPGYAQSRQDNNNTVDNMKKAYGVKSFDQGQQQIPDGTKATTKSGQPVIRKNGQWVTQ